MYQYCGRVEEGTIIVSLKPCPRAPPAKITKPTTLTGFLVSVDTYMNLLLTSTEEYVDGEFAGNLGDVLIRCNNVLYLRGAEGEEEDPKAEAAEGANGMDEDEDEG